MISNNFENYLSSEKRKTDSLDEILKVIVNAFAHIENAVETLERNVEEKMKGVSKNLEEHNSKIQQLEQRIEDVKTMLDTTIVRKDKSDDGHLDDVLRHFSRKPVPPVPVFFLSPSAPALRSCSSGKRLSPCTKIEFRGSKIAQPIIYGDSINRGQSSARIRPLTNGRDTSSQVSLPCSVCGSLISSTFEKEAASNYSRNKQPCTGKCDLQSKGRNTTKFTASSKSNSNRSFSASKSPIGNTKDNSRVPLSRGSKLVGKPSKFDRSSPSRSENARMTFGNPGTRGPNAVERQSTRPERLTADCPNTRQSPSRPTSLVSDRQSGRVASYPNTSQRNRASDKRAQPPYTKCPPCPIDTGEPLSPEYAQQKSRDPLSGNSRLDRTPTFSRDNRSAGNRSTAFNERSSANRRIGQNGQNMSCLDRKLMKMLNAKGINKSPANQSVGQIQKSAGSCSTRESKNGIGQRCTSGLDSIICSFTSANKSRTNQTELAGTPRICDERCLNRSGQRGIGDPRSDSLQPNAEESVEPAVTESLRRKSRSAHSYYAFLNERDRPRNDLSGYSSSPTMPRQISNRSIPGITQGEKCDLKDCPSNQLERKESRSSRWMRASDPQNNTRYKHNSPRYSQGSRYTQNDPRYSQGSRYTQNDPRYSQGSRYTQNDPRYSQGSRYTQNDPRYSQGSRYTQNDPRYPETGSRYQQNDPRYSQSTPRYPQNGSRYQKSDPRYPSNNLRKSNDLTERHISRSDKNASSSCEPCPIASKSRSSEYVPRSNTNYLSSRSFGEPRSYSDRSDRPRFLPEVRDSKSSRSQTRGVNGNDCFCNDTVAPYSSSVYSSNRRNDRIRSESASSLGSSLNAQGTPNTNRPFSSSRSREQSVAYGPPINALRNVCSDPKCPENIQAQKRTKDYVGLNQNGMLDSGFAQEQYLSPRGYSVGRRGTSRRTSGPDPEQTSGLRSETPFENCEPDCEGLQRIQTNKVKCLPECIGRKLNNDTYLNSRKYSSYTNSPTQIQSQGMVRSVPSDPSYSSFRSNYKEQFTIEDYESTNSDPKRKYSSRGQMREPGEDSYRATPQRRYIKPEVESRRASNENMFYNSEISRENSTQCPCIEERLRSNQPLATSAVPTQSTDVESRVPGYSYSTQPEQRLNRYPPNMSPSLCPCPNKPVKVIYQQTTMPSSSRVLPGQALGNTLVPGLDRLIQDKPCPPCVYDKASSDPLSDKMDAIEFSIGRKPKVTVSEKPNKDQSSGEEFLRMLMYKNDERAADESSSLDLPESEGDPNSDPQSEGRKRENWSKSHRSKGRYNPSCEKPSIRQPCLGNKLQRKVSICDRQYKDYECDPNKFYRGTNKRCFNRP